MKKTRKILTQQPKEKITEEEQEEWDLEKPYFFTTFLPNKKRKTQKKQQHFVLIDDDYACILSHSSAITKKGIAIVFSFHVATISKRLLLPFLRTRPEGLPKVRQQKPKPAETENGENL